MYPHFIPDPSASILHTLEANAFPEASPEFSKITSRLLYQPEIVLFGPDAAIEISNGKMTFYLNGVVSNDQAFRGFVRNSRLALFGKARRVRKNPGDRIIFVGKWYHVDYDLDPLFRAYLITRVSESGDIETQAYNPMQRRILPNGRVSEAPKEDFLFWTDEENFYPAYDILEAKALGENPADVFEQQSEETIRRYCLSLTKAGYHSYGSILWHPTVEGFPIIYVPLNGMISRRTKWRWEDKCDLDPAYVKEFKIVDSAINNFKAIVAAESNGGQKSECLNTAYANLLDAVDQMEFEQDRWETRSFVRGLMNPLIFDSDVERLVIKPPLPKVDRITLGDIEKSTSSNGFWHAIRNGSTDEPIAFKFYTFLSNSHHGDKLVELARCTPVAIDGFDDTCPFASDWIEVEEGQERFLAFGPELRLSW